MKYPGYSLHHKQPELPPAVPVYPESHPAEHSLHSDSLMPVLHSHPGFQKPVHSLSHLHSHNSFHL